MQDLPSFVAKYSPAGLAHIAFSWNGKHSTEFVDANQEFRWAVVGYCLANSGDPSPLLLAHLFLADADWSAEAWGSPHHFAQLGALLLQRGEVDALAAFSEGFVRSFDTFGACHAMSLSPSLLARLTIAVTAELATCNDEASVKRLTAARDLFAKLTEGSAAQGWATVAPGTPVSNVRIVWPRWYHKVWTKVKGAWHAT
jgi:hypothetical protein